MRFSDLLAEVFNKYAVVDCYYEREKVDNACSELRAIEEYKQVINFGCCETRRELICAVLAGVIFASKNIPSDVKKFGDYVIDFYEEYRDHYEAVYINQGEGWRVSNRPEKMLVFACIENILEILKEDE